MKKITDTFKIIGVISAIAFATLLLLPTLAFLFKMLINFKSKNISLMLCFFGGIAGYFGLCMLLSKNDTLKFKLLNIILLICGVSSFVGFTSITGGEKAWEWVFTFKEPDEWLFIVYPSIISIIFICSLLIQTFNQKFKSIK